MEEGASVKTVTSKEEEKPASNKDDKEEEFNSAFEVLADFNKETHAHVSTRISWAKSNPSRKIYRIIGPKDEWAAVGYDKQNRIVVVSLKGDLIEDAKEMPEWKTFFTPEKDADGSPLESKNVLAVNWKGYKDLPFENVTRTNIAPYVFTDVVKATGRIVGVYIADAREAFGLIPPRFVLLGPANGEEPQDVTERACEQPQQEQTADQSKSQ